MVAESTACITKIAIASVATIAISIVAILILQVLGCNVQGASKITLRKNHKRIEVKSRSY